MSTCAKFQLPRCEQAVVGSHRLESIRGHARLLLNALPCSAQLIYFEIDGFYGL